jgi:hypothetical protein
MNRIQRRGLPPLAAALLAAAIALILAACGAGGRTDTTTTQPAAAAPTPTGTAPAPATTTTAATTTAAPGPRPVTYGIGDAPGVYASCRPGVVACCDPQTVTCDLHTTQGFATQPLFRRLTVPASAHRVSDVRIFVDYDAVQEWNGSTSSPGCAYSRALDQPWTDLAGRDHPAGQSYQDLLTSVIEARAQGLDPIVAITGYASPHAKPSWDLPAPDPTTVAGYWDYRCGVQGILGALSRLPDWAQPHVWEAMNEPDGFRVYRSLDGREATSCTPAATAQPDGAAKAACDEAIASAEIHGFAGHSQDTVIAGAFIHPSVDYLGRYAAALQREMPGAAFPQTWSVHDYADVTGAYAGPTATVLASFDESLAADTSGHARDLWITEAGTVLTDHHPGPGCPGVGVDPSGTLGACVNGSAGRQATTAAAFFALPNVATAVPITHLFWYQFESAPNWDSGLVDATGQPRAGYCAFVGSGTCNGNPNAS